MTRILRVSVANMGWKQVLTAGLLFGLSAAQFDFTGTTVYLDGVGYFVDPTAAGSVSGWRCADRNNGTGLMGLVPAAVVADEVEVSELDTLFMSWTQKDDAFSEGFLECVFGRLGGKAQVFGNEMAVHKLGKKDDKVASGPYFVNTVTGKAHRVYRLYDDFAQSFTQSLLQKQDGTFQTFSAGVGTLGTLTIGVPSRLYYTKTKDKPLAGVRFGVKDLYRLKGVKGSNGNRAWYHLYPPAEKTAPAVQKLIDAGAVVVGLQSLSQFANGDTFTADAVDMHLPFNPRGDGYNIPQGSSSGAGSSMASYEWLDMALGSDTGGSIRFPALVGGLFGNRPTHGSVSLEDVTPLSPSMDTAGVIVRDVELWGTAQEVLYAGYSKGNSNCNGKKAYPKVLYTVGIPDDQSEATMMLKGFIEKAADTMGAKAVPLDIYALWNRTKPAEAKGSSIQELVNTTYTDLISKDQATMVRDPFYKDYAAKHGGRKPYINPSPLFRWTYSDTLSEEHMAQARKNMTVFGDWFNTNVVKQFNATCSDSILLYPGGFGAPLRRDTYTSGQYLLSGFNLGRLSSYSGAPESSFPIGEVGSLSTVTGQEEKLPVAVEVLAARGCDEILVRLAKDLVRKGVIRKPKAGRSLEGAEILFKREQYF